MPGRTILKAKEVRDDLKKSDPKLAGSTSTKTLIKIASLPERGRTGIFRK